MVTIGPTYFLPGTICGLEALPQLAGLTPHGQLLCPGFSGCAVVQQAEAVPHLDCFHDALASSVCCRHHIGTPSRITSSHTHRALTQGCRLLGGGNDWGLAR